MHFFLYNFCQICVTNIPILPQAFLTFASKSSVGPSYVANGQEDHKTYNQKTADCSGTERKKKKKKKNMVKP